MKDSSTDYSDCTNIVLLVKIEGSVWYTIYHHLPIVKGASPLFSSTNQWEFGTSMDCTTYFGLHPKNRSCEFLGMGYDDDDER